MHIGHILLVEAESKEEAKENAQAFVESYVQGGWSDWSEIGGRWEGFFDGEDVLCYSTNPTLFEEKIAMWQEGMKEEQDRLLDQVGDKTIRELVVYYADENNKKNLVDTDEYLTLWRAFKVLKMNYGSSYSEDDQVFDIVDYSRKLTEFRKRVEEKPQNQYAVIWDFHF
jgi:hypothetical protein